MAVTLVSLVSVTVPTVAMKVADVKPAGTVTDTGVVISEL